MTEKICNKCGTNKSKKWYKVLLLSLDRNDKAVEVIEGSFCYTCRRAYGRFIRNE